jgi:hypothetical protein
MNHLASGSGINLRPCATQVRRATPGGVTNCDTGLSPLGIGCVNGRGGREAAAGGGCCSFCRRSRRFFPSGLLSLCRCTRRPLHVGSVGGAGGTAVCRRRLLVSEIGCAGPVSFCGRRAGDAWCARWIVHGGSLNEKYCVSTVTAHRTHFGGGSPRCRGGLFVGGSVCRGSSPRSRFLEAFFRFYFSKFSSPVLRCDVA